MPTATRDDEVVGATGSPDPGTGAGESAEAGSRGAHPLLVALTALVDQLASSADEAQGWVAVDALLTLDRQMSRLIGVCARLLATVEADGLWATEGARSVAHWFAGRQGATHGRARGMVRLARALRDHLPATEAALVAGDVDADHAHTLARLAPTTEQRQEALAAPADECGEEFLLAEARLVPADSFGRLVRRWAAAADPEADERGYRQACEREFVSLASTTGGYHLAGFLTTEHGATVNAALEAVTTPPAPDDTRTAQQRRAQALADVARLVLDHGVTGTGAAVRPHISCVVDFDTLRRTVSGDDASRPRPGADSVHTTGAAVATDPAATDPSDAEPAGTEPGDTKPGDTNPARTDPSGTGQPRERHASSGSDCLFRLAPVADVERFAVAEVLGAGPIPGSVLARLACDSEIHRVVFGPDSQVINVGRAERTYSGPRRKAVIARDHTCRYPGCTAPPALGEIHHIAEWVKDHGDTDVNLGILLCWYHHDLVHRLHIEIRRSPTGGWLFLTRHGTPVDRAT